MDYYIIATLVAASVTIVPKILPLFFLRGKKFNKRLLTFFKIIPYTSMTVLIVKYVLTAKPNMIVPTIITIITTTIASYLTENMIVAVLVSIITTFICLNF